VTRRDRGLERVRAVRAAERLRPLERREPATDEEPVPARTVLVRQQDGLAAGSDARVEPRRLDLHQRDESMHLGLARHEPGDDAAEPKRVVAERGPHPVVAGRRGVALVEDQVDDLEYRGQAGREVGAARDLERDAFLRERPLRANDALRDRRFGDEERARDLVRREAAEETERQRDAGLGREHGMARDEDEAEEVVADGVVDRRVEVGGRELAL